MGVGTAPRMSRAEHHARFAALRAQGMRPREIAEVLGVSRSFVAEVLADPLRVKDKQRKLRYRGSCRDCGNPTDGSNGRPYAPPLCFGCTQRERAFWDADRCVDAIRRFAAMFGQQPSAADFQPSLARSCPAETQALHRMRNAAGDWPNLNTVRSYCGSWNAAIVAAGFDPHIGRRRIILQDDSRPRAPKAAA